MKRTHHRAACLVAATLLLSGGAWSVAQAQTSSGVTSSIPAGAGGPPVAMPTTEAAKENRAAGSTEPTGKVKHRRKLQSKGSNVDSEVQNSGPRANAAKPGTTN